MNLFLIGTSIYIYIGTVNVNLDIVEDLWRAADQYLLDHLKSICEYDVVGVDKKLCFYFFCFCRKLLNDLI